MTPTPEQPSDSAEKTPKRVAVIGGRHARIEEMALLGATMLVLAGGPIPSCGPGSRKQRSEPRGRRLDDPHKQGRAYRRDPITGLKLRAEQPSDEAESHPDA